jgi:hypothetical protein
LDRFGLGHTGDLGIVSALSAKRSFGVGRASTKVL